MNRRTDEPMKALAALAVTGIVGVAFVARWRFLSSSPWPFGIDGFYYAVQLRSLLQDQQLYYPASPLVFWLLLPGAWLMGPIAGTKMGAALGTALACVPIYAIVRRATGERAAGVLGAALVATAAGSFHLATEFVKQAVGLTLALAFVASLGALLDQPPGERRRAWAIATVALFIACLMAHLTSVGIAVLFALPPVVVRILKTHGADRNRAIGFAAAAVAVVLAFIIVFVPTVRLGMGLANMFGPASFAFTGENTFHHEVTLAAIAATILLILMRMIPQVGNQSPESRALLIGPSLLALGLALPWLSAVDSQGLVLRLRIMAFVPLAVCAPAALTLLLSRFAPRVQSVAVVAVAAIVLAVVPLQDTNGTARANELQMPAIEAIAAHTPADAIILVDDRRLAFMVKWLTDREARRDPSGLESETVFRYAGVGLLPPSVLKELGAFERRLPPEVPRPVLLHSRGRWPLLLFPEETWQALLQSLSAEDRAVLEPWPGVR